MAIRTDQLGRWLKVFAAIAVTIALFTFLTPAITQSSGTRIVRVRIQVADAEDHHRIQHARVRMFQPYDPNERVISASTSYEGWVELVAEFFASGGGDGCRHGEYISYYDWCLEVEAPGYRRFRAPLYREITPRPGDPPMNLPQPVHGRATATVLLTPEVPAF